MSWRDWTREPRDSKEKSDPIFSRSMEWLVPLSLWGSKVFRIGPPTGTQCVFRIVTKSEDLAQPTHSPQVIIIMALKHIHFTPAFLLGLRNAGMIEGCVYIRTNQVKNIVCKQHNDTLLKPTRQIFHKVERGLKPISDRYISMDSCWGSHLDPCRQEQLVTKMVAPSRFFCGCYFAQTTVDS